MLRWESSPTIQLDATACSVRILMQLANEQRHYKEGKEKRVSCRPSPTTQSHHRHPSKANPSGSKVTDTASRQAKRQKRSFRQRQKGVDVETHLWVANVHRFPVDNSTFGVDTFWSPTGSWRNKDVCQVASAVDYCTFASQVVAMTNGIRAHLGGRCYDRSNAECNRFAVKHCACSLVERCLGLMGVFLVKTCTKRCNLKNERIAAPKPDFTFESSCSLKEGAYRVHRC